MSIVVGGIGPKDAKITLVGEALGEQEVRQGEPFVGRAGQLLNRLLQTAGIARGDCYITNVIKERPDKNFIKPWIDLTRKEPFVSRGYLNYVETLKEELSEVESNVIVAVGNIPLWTLVNLQKITKRRGSIYESVLLPGRKVIPIIHPSAILHGGKRTYMQQHYTVLDLIRIKKESEYPEVMLPKRHYIIEPSYITAMEFLAMCSGKPLVAFDIEVTNEEVACISFAYDSVNVISIPFTKKGLDYFPLDQEVSIWKAIGIILENKNIEKVAQNAVFDSTILLRKYGFKIRPLQDTMIAQAVFIPDFPKGLDFIASIWTKEPYYKDEGKFRIKSGGGTDRDFWLYNAKDSVVLMDTLPKLKEELTTMRNLGTYETQLELVEPLVYMSERGMRVDAEGLKAESEKVGNKLDILTEQIITKTGGIISNPKSSKQVMDYFYIHKGHKPYIKRGTKKPTGDKNALKRLARKGFEVAEIMLEHRRWSKLKDTYLDVTLDSDGRLRNSMNPVGAADSGRFSSSKTIFDTGTNVQTLPAEMKPYILADEGYMMYNIDLAQADNRCVAYIAPEPNMIQVFEMGRDLHAMTASLMFNKSVGEVSDEEGSSTIGNGRHSERYWGKKSNHAFNYGEGYKTFAFDNELPEREAKIIRQAYHTSYPGIRQYWAWIEERLRIDNRMLSNPYGRRRKFLGRWGPEVFMEAYSWIPQSTVADKINRDGILFMYKNQQWFKELEILNQVHDSVVIQIPIEIGWEAHADMLLKIRQSLEAPITWRINQFSIPVDIEMGYNLKDTEDIILPDGFSQSLKTLTAELEKRYIKLKGNNVDT